MDKHFFIAALLAASLGVAAPATLAAPPTPADAPTGEPSPDEGLSDEDRPPGDTPDYVVGEMLCALPR